MANRIKELRKSKGWTQGDLSAQSGVDTSYISRLETGRRGKSKAGKGGPTYSIVKAIADALGREPEDVFDADELYLVSPPSSERHQPPPRGTAAILPVPVRGVAAGSHSRGSFQFTGDTIEYVDRPRALLDIRSLFAFYIQGDSMEPEHSEGDLRFATKDRPPRPGDSVVIEARDDPSDERTWAVIGHLVRRGEEVVLGKLNPKSEIRIPRLSIVETYKVLSTNELFGK